MTRPRFRYSPWDGTQRGFELDALDVMEQLTDDLLYHGDLNSALRRMMQQGFEDRNGERIQGMREMLERLRERRQDTLDRYDLGGVYDDIADELREVVQTERDELARQVEEARDVRRPAPVGADRAERGREEPRARHVAARPGRPGQGARAVRLRLVGGPGALRGAHGEAARAAHAAVRQPDVGSDGEHLARGHGPDEGHARRAEPHARTARAR